VSDGVLACEIAEDGVRVENLKRSPVEYVNFVGDCSYREGVDDAVLDCHRERVSLGCHYERVCDRVAIQTEWMRTDVSYRCK
jgi:hypothetical protein